MNRLKYPYMVVSGGFGLHSWYQMNKYLYMDIFDSKKLETYSIDRCPINRLCLMKYRSSNNNLSLLDKNFNFLFYSTTIGTASFIIGSSTWPLVLCYKFF
jgi:hypothetical protein